MLLDEIELKEKREVKRGEMEFEETSTEGEELPSFEEVLECLETVEKSIYSEEEEK